MTVNDIVGDTTVCFSGMRYYKMCRPLQPLPDGSRYTFHLLSNHLWDAPTGRQEPIL